MEAPDDIAEIQRRFLAAIGRIEGHAHNRFRHLHGDEREEAVDEVRAIAWKMYRQLWLEGREPDELVGGIASFAVKSVRSGRRLVGKNPVNDVLSPCFRRGHSLGSPREEECVDDRSPAEEAVLSVDLEEWLAGLNKRQRSLVNQLLSGLNTVAVAPLHGVSRGRISQLREELARSWEAFFEEE